MTDDERSKRPTDPLHLPPGDRVIIANQMEAISARIARNEKRGDQALTRSNIAIGMSIVAMIGMIVRLILTVH